ncbi:hypothetical protein LWM68_24600 [Niabella sp. W65]|nr:hypothetical protein [Niabella sp. W65]MCH7365675.1 hypothetical protein [Niabella sp. W65]
MAIKHIGFSLTYAISVGISCVLGTLVPPMLAGTLGEALSGTGGQWILTGVILGAAGIAFCGVAGRLKEKDVSQSRAGFLLKKDCHYAYWPVCYLHFMVLRSMRVNLYQILRPIMVPAISR